VPPARPFNLAGVSLIDIFYPVAKRIDRPGQFPGENVLMFQRIRISDDSRILPLGAGASRPWRTIEADESVLAANLPIILTRTVVMQNTGEQSLCPGNVARSSLTFFDWDQIFRPGEHIYVTVLGICWDPF